MHSLTGFDRLCTGKAFQESMSEATCWNRPECIVAAIRRRDCVLLGCANSGRDELAEWLERQDARGEENGGSKTRCRRRASITPNHRCNSDAAVVVGEKQAERKRKRQRERVSGSSQMRSQKLYNLVSPSLSVRSSSKSTHLIIAWLAYLGRHVSALYHDSAWYSNNAKIEPLAISLRRFLPTATVPFAALPSSLAPQHSRVLADLDHALFGAATSPPPASGSHSPRGMSSDAPSPSSPSFQLRVPPGVGGGKAKPAAPGDADAGGVRRNAKGGVFVAPHELHQAFEFFDVEGKGESGSGSGSDSGCASRCGGG